MGIFKKKINNGSLMVIVYSFNRKRNRKSRYNIITIDKVISKKELVKKNTFLNNEGIDIVNIRFFKTCAICFKLYINSHRYCRSLYNGGRATYKMINRPAIKQTNPTNKIIFYDLECDGLTTVSNHNIVLGCLIICDYLGIIESTEVIDCRSNSLNFAIKLANFCLNLSDSNYITSEYTTIYIVSYNGSKYDDILILDQFLFLLKGRMLNYNIFNQNGATVMDYVSLPNVTVKFKDYVRFFPQVSGGLKGIATALSLKINKLDYDLKLINASMSDIEYKKCAKYCKYDTLILVHIFLKMQPFCDDMSQSIISQSIDHLAYHGSPSLSNAILLNSFSDKLIYPVKTTANAWYMSIYGGWVGMTMQKAAIDPPLKLQCLDIKSHYPNAMHGPFPTGNVTGASRWPQFKEYLMYLKKFKNPDLIDFEDKRFAHGLLHVSFTFDITQKRYFIVFFPSRQDLIELDVNNKSKPVYRKLCWNYKNGEGYYNTVDLCIGACEGFEFNLIDDSVNTFFSGQNTMYRKYMKNVSARKTEAEAKNNLALKWLLKVSMLNSPIGKLLQRRTESQIIIGDYTRSGFQVLASNKNQLFGDVYEILKPGYDLSIPLHHGSIMYAYSRYIRMMIRWELEKVCPQLFRGNIENRFPVILYGDTDSFIIADRICNILKKKAPHLFLKQIGDYTHGKFTYHVDTELDCVCSINKTLFYSFVAPKSYLIVNCCSIKKGCKSHRFAKEMTNCAHNLPSNYCPYERLVLEDQLSLFDFLKCFDKNNLKIIKKYQKIERQLITNNKGLAIKNAERKISFSPSYLLNRFRLNKVGFLIPLDSTNNCI